MPDSRAAHPTDARFLVRLDSGNDSADTLDICAERAADFLIKRNLRREKPEDWLARAKKEGTAIKEREGKTVYQGACQLSPRADHDPVRVVYQVTERTITAQGQVLLLPDVEVATYWTSLQEGVPPTKRGFSTVELAYYGCCGSRG